MSSGRKTSRKAGMQDITESPSLQPPSRRKARSKQVNDDGQATKSENVSGKNADGLEKQNEHPFYKIEKEWSHDVQERGNQKVDAGVRRSSPSSRRQHAEDERDSLFDRHAAEMQRSNAISHRVDQRATERDHGQKSQAGGSPRAPPRTQGHGDEKKTLFDQHTAEMRDLNSIGSNNNTVPSRHQSNQVSGEQAHDLDQKRHINQRGAVARDPPSYENVQGTELAQHLSEQENALWQNPIPAMSESDVKLQHSAGSSSGPQRNLLPAGLDGQPTGGPIGTTNVAQAPHYESNLVNTLTMAANTAVPAAQVDGSPDPPLVRPGAYAIHGPGFDGAETVSDWTVQIGDGDNDGPSLSVPLEALPEEPLEALDATVVGAHQEEEESLPEEELPPLVEAQVDKSWTIRDRRVQIIIGLVLIALLGAVLGIVFGVVVNGGSGGEAATPSPTAAGPTAAPTITGTLAPTISSMPSSAPTFLSIEDAGSFSVSVGFPSVPLSYSRDGNRVAIADSTSSVTVYQEDLQQPGSWTQIGNTISITGAVSVSLAGDRIAVGSTGATSASVSVLELVAETSWTRVGNVISSVEGWNVALSQDGTIVAAEGTNTVQVFSVNEGTNNDWVQRGNDISTSSARSNEGNAYSRMAMSNDGNTLAVDLSVYQYNVDQDTWSGQALLGLTSNPPDTPVSISGNGLAVAIGQPSSNTNGANSGVVIVFGFNGNSWTRIGDEIIGAGEVRGFWGFAHALSEDGSRIAAMNNPQGGTNRAYLYRLQGSSWTRVFDEQLPTAFNDGAIGLSADGNRVAVAGQSSVQFYTVVGNSV